MPTGHRTEPLIEESVAATYLVQQSYKKTARIHKMPISTVYLIIKRLAGDAVAQERIAMRADIARLAHRKVAELIRLVSAANLGTEKSSQGFEAARAAESIARAASLIAPAEDEPQAEVPPIVLHVKHEAWEKSTAPVPITADTSTTTTPPITTDDTTEKTPA